MSWWFCCPTTSAPAAVRDAQRLYDLLNELNAETAKLRTAQTNLPEFLSSTANPIVLPLRRQIVLANELAPLLRRLRAESEAPDAPLDLLIDVAQADAGLHAAQRVYCSLRDVVAIYLDNPTDRQPFAGNLARVRSALRHAGALAVCDTLPS